MTSNNSDLKQPSETKIEKQRMDDEGGANNQSYLENESHAHDAAPSNEKKNLKNP